MKILSPGYGRDYKTAALAVKDYKNGLYFVLETLQNPPTSRYCSIRDFPDEEVEIRFDRMTRFTIV